MRAINLIIFHCSDSDRPNHDDISVIAQWHSERGWVGPDKINGTQDDVGYHYFIKKNGAYQKGRPDDAIGAHCKGYNANSIGICLSGKNDFTDAQFLMAAKLAKELMSKYNLKITDILGHNELEKTKTCPNFKLEEIFKRINS